MTGTIKNVSVLSASINLSTAGSYIGIVAGKLTGGVAENITVSGCVNAELSNYVGGIFGYYGRNGSYTMENMVNKASVSGNDYIGGIFGGYRNSVSDYYNNYNVYLNKFENSGNVTANGKYAGGIAGHYYAYNTDNYTMYSYLSEITNTGNVEGTTYVGGMIGYCDAESGSIKQSSSSADIKAKTYVGGFFGKDINLEINNCTNEGSTVTATGYEYSGTEKDGYVGGYAGYGSAVSNSTNYVSINYTEGGRYVGGCCGYATAIGKNAINEGKINAPDSDYVGGIYGYVTYGGSYTIEGVKNGGEITGKNNVGGIFGGYRNSVSDHYNNYNVYLNKFENSGNVTANGKYAGGIAGHYYAYNTDNYTMYSYLSEITNTGNIEGTTYVGGIIGYCDVETSASFIQTSSSTGTVTGDSDYGDLFGRQGNMTIK